MLNSNSFLAECQKLKEQGVVFPLRPGVRLGRGFADYGFEEFYLLPGKKIVSLFTGQTSEWLENHEKFFFVVPDQFSLLDQIQRRSAEIVEISYPEQRKWEVRFTSPQGVESSEDLDFNSLLVRVLLQVSR